MKRVSFFGVFCLSGLLFIMFVDSQTHCPTGWFGTRCRFKCRCVNNSCGNEGNCTNPSGCQGGWFGLACQYADLAYGRGNLPVITDGKDSTCLHSRHTANITLTLAVPGVFTWLRVRVNEPDVIDKLTVRFKLIASQVDCQNLRLVYLDGKTVDIYCNMTQLYNTVILAGDATLSLCSLYISGGCNVALRETATQALTYEEISPRTNNVMMSFVADKAVDGNTDQNFYGNFSCSHTAIENATWILVLSTPALVNRYVIYNRLDDDLGERIKGFRLESLDSRKKRVFVHEDTNSMYLSVYSMTHPPTEVKTVIITQRQEVLTLCEVEVYGDIICPNGYFGLECEKFCSCPGGNETCLANNGGCPSGCAFGYHGLGCMQACPPETFGVACEKKCSDFCVTDSNERVSCNDMAGTCTHGCLPGYEGTSCTQTCPMETFGQDCNSVCSEACEASGDQLTSPCHHVNGSCVAGCKSGYLGPQCTSACPIGTFGPGCSSACSKACAFSGDVDTSPCDNVDGVCVAGCKEGTIGPHCIPECENGMYGVNCNRQCSPRCALFVDHYRSSCRSTDGKCLKGCVEGYRGPFCELECREGTFGRGCKQKCSAKCAPSLVPGNSSCNHTNGVCFYGCAPGYGGLTCNIDCSSKTYYQECDNCSTNCEPFFKQQRYACTRIDGICLNGCIPGYRGSRCELECDNSTYGKECKKKCPIACIPFKNRDISPCKNTNGVCLNGCVRGYSGPFCEVVKNALLRNVLSLVGTASSVLIITFALCCLYNKEDPLEEEGESDIWLQQVTIF